MRAWILTVAATTVAVCALLPTNAANDPAECDVRIASLPQAMAALQGAARGTVVCLAPGDYSALAVDHFAPGVTLRAGAATLTDVNGERGVTARFAATPAAPRAGQPVTLDARATTCDDPPCTYAWSDEPPIGGAWPLGRGAIVRFTFTDSGTKHVTLRVTDADGDVGVQRRDVAVS